MTLDTAIFVTDPIDHQKVFDKVNDLLNIPATRLTRDEATEGGYWEKYGNREISNHIGQGFDAWVMSYSNADGSMVEVDHAPDEDDIVDSSPDYYVRFSIDTGYGYRGGMGETPSMLHAKLIVDLHNWLAEQGVALSWQNEFTGEIHQGVAGIEEFVGGGDAADEWFRSLVLPAISRGEFSRGGRKA